MAKVLMTTSKMMTRMMVGQMGKIVMMKIKSLPMWHRSFCRAIIECLFSESDAGFLKQARENCQCLQVYEMLVEQGE
jgi:hypothetical protein